MLFRLIPQRLFVILSVLFKVVEDRIQHPLDGLASAAQGPLLAQLIETLDGVLPQLEADSLCFVSC